MRIIAGEFKGKRLFSPKDNKIRPTTDKVKESIFNMIADYLDGSVVIDLFAGSGNLGLEALSRGAVKCYFGDKSRESLNLIRQNVEHCKQENNSIIISGDYERVLNRINEKVDVIFLDPPYYEGLTLNCFMIIDKLELLAEDGIIVAEHSSRIEMPDNVCGFTLIKKREYGTITVSIYSLISEENDEC